MKYWFYYHQFCFTDSPTVTSKADNLFRGIDGETVTAHCTAIGNPLVSPSFEWTGPNGNINSTEKYVLEESIDRSDAVKGTIITGMLTIVNFVSGTDVGTYSCTITNNYGEDGHTLEIKEASKWLNSSQLAKMKKKIFLACLYHKIQSLEAVGLKNVWT